MEHKCTQSSSDNASPVLMRRRLSAPETIMRKHFLAQQLSEESGSSQSSVKTCDTFRFGAMGSDTNLMRHKRDCGFMRKSTLLRRMWSNSKPVQPGQYYGSFGRLSQGRSTTSLNSNHSSPEHLKRRSLNLSPKHRNTKEFAAKITTGTNTQFDNCSSSIASTDNLDSAYTNSRSNHNYVSSYNSRTSTCSSDIQKLITGFSDGNNESAVKTEDRTNMSTQTSDMTNINVISNVHLSQSTLDMIYSQVIKDVKNKIPDAITINTISASTIPEAKEVPFYLKEEVVKSANSRHTQIVKYMLSNVGTGTPYTSAETCQTVVPRLSALPRTTSMEVNASTESTDEKESDTLSLADSLEDHTSSNLDNTSNKLDDKPVRGDLPISLPDNSDSKKHKTNKPFAYFIPIDENNKNNSKCVSDHLPDSLKEKLRKRQLKREEKAEQSRRKLSMTSDSNYISSSDRFVQSDSHSSDYNSNNINKTKKKPKPLLPTIQTIRKIKFVNNDNNQTSSKYTCNTTYKNGSSTTKSSYWLPKGHHKVTEKLSPLRSTKKEYVYTSGGGRIYHKTEMSEINKRIEILEIMECSEEGEDKVSHLQKGRSKIPVLVHKKLPKIPSYESVHLEDKPAFLDLKPIPVTDSNFDQLIANILIDSLNVDEIHNSNMQQLKEEANTNKNFKRFEVIPEEISLHSSVEGAANNNNESENIKENENNNNPEEEENNYKGKEALNLVKDGNLATIPQGWITFYMMQKSQGTPESTSDEGKKKIGDNKECEEIAKDTKAISPNLDEKNISTTKETKKSSSAATESDGSTIIRNLPQVQQRSKRNYIQRRRYRSFQSNQQQKQGWFVTVSGTLTEKFAPNLEMRLKFGKPDKTSENDSTSQKRSSFSTRQHSSRHSETFSNENDASCVDSYRLPEIHNKGRFKRKIIRGEPPRQTKTSSRRILLHRPKQLSIFTSDNTVDSDLIQNEKNLDGTPHFLTVIGNAIYPKRKSSLYSNNGRNFYFD